MKTEVIMNEEKKETDLVVSKNALQSMAERLQINPESLKKTLKATVIKDIKTKDGRYRAITDEEFISFIIVANAYGLNPLTKEIYAFPDIKSNGIIPVVSTDGWNKIMTQHKNYVTHFYKFSEKLTTPKGGKPCPEWIEIHIEKQNGKMVVIREYLDECFNGNKRYSCPWDTHTKRMLRHKTKIQGAREAFGFGGIYDKDEAERIIDAVAEEEIPMKPEVQIPEVVESSKEAEPIVPVDESVTEEKKDDNTKS